MSVPIKKTHINHSLQIITEMSEKRSSGILHQHNKKIWLKPFLISVPELKKNKKDWLKPVIIIVELKPYC